MLSIPIPAVRNYESASITEAPAPVEEPALESAGHTGHVLHNTNGAIGVVTVGLATENIDLNGRYVISQRPAYDMEQCTQATYGSMNWAAALRCMPPLTCEYKPSLLCMQACNCCILADCIEHLAKQTHMLIVHACLAGRAKPSKQWLRA